MLRKRTQQIVKTVPLEQVLREKLGFTGMIVSDCGAVHIIETNYNYSQNVAQAGLRGGCDIDCGTAYAASVPAALKDGSIDETDVNLALNRSLSQLVSLGLANPKPPAPWDSLGEDDIDTPAHRALAKDAAMQGFVLLKNEGDALPLKPPLMTSSSSQAATTRSAAGKLKVAVLGAETCLSFVCHFIINANDRAFAKTGSGQTQGKLKNRFCRAALQLFDATSRKLLRWKRSRHVTDATHGSKAPLGTGHCWRC